MIINFSVKNYLSIKETQSFQMIAAPIREKFESCNENKFTIRKDIELLKSSVIYGANASGKSNFIKSILFLRDLVLVSGNLLPQQELNFLPFVLNSKSQNQPSEFEITFFWNKIIYRYGFTGNRKSILKEWLYIKDVRETLVFERKGNNVEIPIKYEILRELKSKKMIRPNALLLSIAAQFNDKTSKEVFQWFANLNIVFGLADQIYNNYSINLLEDLQNREIMLSLLKVADFGIEDLKVIETEGNNIAFTIKGSDIQNPAITKGKSLIKNVKSIKNVLNEKGQIESVIEVPFEFFESEGTKKFFHLLGPILDTLKHGKVLIVDELDTKLHPLLTQRIVKLFNSNSTNPKNAQLIFATHDTQLLDAKTFRRDQIWFAEKKIDGSTNLYSLIDFKKGSTPRNDEKLAKNYIYGKYGAIPYLGDFDDLFEEYTN